MSKKTFIILILPALALVGGYLLKEALATSNPHSWTNGLVGYWSFDGQYTTSTAGTRDVSNNGNWGAFNGGVKPTAGVVGQALSFDGTNDYVDLGTAASLNPTDPLTVGTWEAWVKPNNIHDRSIFYSDKFPEISIYYWGRIGFYDKVLGWLYAPNGTATLYEWQHLVWVKDGTSLKIYRNAVVVLDTTCTASWSVTGAHWWIGSAVGITRFFNGLIDEVRIYNRALSADEVMMHYQQTRRNLGI